MKGKTTVSIIDMKGKEKFIHKNKPNTTSNALFQKIVDEMIAHSADRINIDDSLMGTSEDGGNVTTKSGIGVQDTLDDWYGTDCTSDDGGVVELVNGIEVTGYISYDAGLENDYDHAVLGKDVSILANAYEGSGVEFATQSFSTASLTTGDKLKIVWTITY